MAARQESGPLKIGDDWPGYFMRGDDALSTAATLRMIADSLDKPEVREAAKSHLRLLAETFEDCRVANKSEAA